MSATADKLSGDFPLTPDLLKSFNLLKSHASKVINFTHQWEELEQHLRSIDASIQSKIDLLQHQSGPPEPIRVSPAPESPKPDVSQPENLNFDGLVVHDGEALLAFMNEHLKDKEASRDLISEAIRVCAGCGRIVLDAVRWFYPAESNKSEMRGEISVVRRSCVVLLEEMTRVRPVILPEVKE